METLVSLLEAWLTPQVLIGIILAFVSVYCMRVVRPKNFPPGPNGFPVVGVLPSLGNDPEAKFFNWSKTYGSVMSVRMALEDFVILNDYESITEALVQKKELVSGRPTNRVFEFLSEGVAFADYSPAYKVYRKFGLSTLREFGVGKKSVEERVIEEVRYLNQFIQNQHGKPFDIAAIMYKAVSNNLCSVAFGRRFEYSDPKFARMILLLNRSISDVNISKSLTLIRFASWLRHIPPFSTNLKQFVNDTLELRGMFRDMIDDHKASLDKNNPRDVIDKFLISMDEDTTGYFVERKLVFFGFDLFLGGTETTTSTLRWALIVMVHNPEAQKKLRKEIVDVLGNNGTATMSHRTKMPYTMAFIEELNRYRTLLPLSLMHKTTGHVKLGGYDVPKNTTVLPNLWAVHNNENLWDNPDQFRPERHLDENGNFVSSKYVIPFSLGGRRCLGEQLAKTELFLFVVSMVQKFNFLPAPDGLPSLIIESGIGVTVPAPYKIIAKEL